MDVLESDTACRIVAELPGVGTEEVKLSVEGRDSVSSWRREPVTAEEGTRSHRIARASGSFHRSFSVPDSVDETKVQASLRTVYGILTVYLLKMEKAKPKSIEVEVE